MKIIPNINITDKQGYEAMILTLKYYFELTKSDDLTDILSAGEYVENDTPADPIFWYYYQESIAKIKANDDDEMYKKFETNEE